MVRRLAPVVVIAALIGLALLGTPSAGAQYDPGPAPVPIVPVQCRPVLYDLTGDSRLDIQDLNRWRLVVTRGTGTCQLGAPAASCPSGFDADGNGFVELADLARMIAHYRTCLPSPGIRVTP